MGGVQGPLSGPTVGLALPLLKPGTAALLALEGHHFVKMHHYAERHRR